MDILELFITLTKTKDDNFSSSELLPHTAVSLPTLKRALKALVERGDLIRVGSGPSTRYRLSEDCLKRILAFDKASSKQVASTGAIEDSEALQAAERLPFSETFDSYAPAFPVSDKSKKLLFSLSRPLGKRKPVSYDRSFLEAYVPNDSSLLPIPLAKELSERGRLKERLPAATYARKVLEQLLIDLSYSSSKLEGNKYSLLATEKLFQLGGDAPDMDAVMLLNHKAAIEYMVDAVPEEGLKDSLVRSLHAILMRDLIDGPANLGEIRTAILSITDSVYIPLQIPQLLSQYFELILDKAKEIRNPIEASFFLWVNIAYLQPFIDGNKRLSRLVSNIPLMLYNHAPLSFLDIDAKDYAVSMMAVYEERDLSLAIDLYKNTYTRSIDRYSALLTSMGAPNPIRVTYRATFDEAIQRIVRDQKTVEDVLSEIEVKKEDLDAFRVILDQEVTGLNAYNCARYRLRPLEVQAWLSSKEKKNFQGAVFRE